MSSPLRFRLDRELGSGATGRVWHGVLTEGFSVYPAGFEVAVKYIRPEREDDPVALAGFLAEADAGRAVTHPGVVHVLYSGRDERGRFLVMPFVPGRNLSEVLAEAGALPEPLVRSIARQISGGLAALHEAGFVHADVTPVNMRLDAEGNAVLIDLGFAHRLASHPATSASEANSTASAATARTPRRGTLSYLAPEQARGEAPSFASDVFALGVVIYELATGVHPFTGFMTGPTQPADGNTGGSTRGTTRRRALFEGTLSSGMIARTALERPDADKLLAAMAAPRFVAPSRFVPQLSPFLDRLTQDLLQRDASRRPSSAELCRRLVEQERGSWWRDEIQFEADARRGGSGERDAQYRTPLVGREAEMERLFIAYDAAARARESPGATPRDSTGATPHHRAPDAASITGAGGAVWIRGQEGSGKSRLISEFASRTRTREDPPLYLYGRCRELEEERPCQPLLELLGRYLRLPPGVAPKRRESELLSQLVPPRVAETLVQVLDPDFEGSTAISIQSALASWLIALGERMPLVIFLDDLNWALEDTIGALEMVVEDISKTRMLLVLGEQHDAPARNAPGLKRLEARLAAQSRLTAIELQPLDEDAVLSLVRRLFHHSVPRLRLSSVLWQRSRGNPGLITELLRSMIARGEARPHADGGGLSLNISPDDLPLPGSLHKAIAQSYKELPAQDRTWLRRLAVVGGRIETDFLLHAFPDAKRAEVDAMLARLVRSGWIAASGHRYRFTRPALRSAVYRSIPREQRVRLHASAAEALRPAHGDHLSLEDAFQLAFHLRSAHDHTTLLRVLRPLLPRLLKGGQPQRVHALSMWGLEAIDALEKSSVLDKMRIDLLETAVDAADRLGFREGQRQLLDRLSDLEFDPALDPESVGRVYLLHGRYAVSTGQYGLARGMLRNAVEMFERAGAKLELSEAMRRLSAVQGHVGELAEARDLARRAVQHAQHDAQRALAHLALGVIDVLEDRVEPALKNAEEALKLLRRDSNYNLPGAYAAVYMLRARVYRASGSPARALASASLAMRLARVAGERRLEAEATARLGGMLVDLDRSEEAEARLREALLLAQEIEDRRGEALARVFLGILLWENGDREAGPMFTRTLELALEMGLNRIEAVTLAFQARMHRAAGELARAEHASARAMELLQRFGAELGDRVVITGTRALVLRALKRDAEADALEKRLRDHLRRENARIQSPLLRLRHQRYSNRLLESVLSPEGKVYPRASASDDLR